MDISIQFHALPEELLEFTRNCIQNYNVYISSVSYSPYNAEELDCQMLPNVFSDGSTVQELVFTLGRPNLQAKGNVELWNNNPDILRLQIGRKTEKGVEESHLSARTENPDAIAVWKKIANQLKGITDKGAMAVNPHTGATGPARWHRFTPGAKALESSGIPMITVTGVVLKLGEKTDVISTKQKHS